MKPSKIAITGGLGSGKSAVCAIIQELGYPVFSCDAINRALWQDASYLSVLREVFPDCLTEGTPDKAKITARVFTDSVALQRLNEISHPRIMKQLLEDMSRHPVSFGEVPLLFEGGYAPLFDRIIAVRREREARICAVMQRDGATREQVLLRMAQQFDPARLESTGCLIVENNGSHEALRRAVIQTLEKLHIL